MAETVMDDAETEKDTVLFPAMPADMNKSRLSGQKIVYLKHLQKDESSAKSGDKRISVKDKLMRALGMRKEISSSITADKLSVLSDSGEAGANNPPQRIQEQTKAPKRLSMQEFCGNPMDKMHMHDEIRVGTTPLGNDRLTERLTELETHVKEIHSAFDNFVLHSDQFLNYEQFLDIQNEVKEKIQLLDKLEKSLEESKNMILKDAGYMDQILEGFNHNKKKIELLESRLAAMSAQMSANSSLQQNKSIKMPLPADAKCSGALSASEAGIVADLKKELVSFKKNEDSKQNDFLKLRESMSSFDKRMNKISGDLDASKKNFDDMNRKITHIGAKNETSNIDALRMQINDISQRLDDIDKRQKAGNGARVEAIINKDVDERISRECKDLKASLKSEFDAQINALRRSMQENADVKVAESPAKKDVEQMNADMSEVRANIDRIKSALHGL